MNTYIKSYCLSYSVSSPINQKQKSSMAKATFFYSSYRKTRKKKMIVIASIVFSVISVAVLAFVGISLLSESDVKSEKVIDEFDLSEGVNPDLNNKETNDVPVVDNRGLGIYSGVPCDIPNRRAITVTVSSDTAARPPLGISQADMIFEVPSTGDSGRHTRLLALFSCNAPTKVRSVRSSRKYFGDFSMSVDGVIAHWGSSTAGRNYFSQLVKSGDLNRINALILQGKYFSRDYSGGVTRKEDSGTANVSNLYGYIEEKGWDTITSFEGYNFLSEEEINTKKSPTAGTLAVSFRSSTDRVKYNYDPLTNKYKRIWGGKIDKDGTTGTQIEASNIITMQTKITSQTDPHYAFVTTTGSGPMSLYQNGQVITGTWERGTEYSDKIYFKDSFGIEVKLTPGQTWIEVVEASYSVTWTS